MMDDLFPSCFSFVDLIMSSSLQSVFSAPSELLIKETCFQTFMNNLFLKEDGSNFLDWEANVRNAAMVDGKLRYLVDPPPPKPTSREALAVRFSYDEYQKESCVIKNVLTNTMAPSLHWRFINSRTHEILPMLRKMFSGASGSMSTENEFLVVPGKGKRKYKEFAGKGWRPKPIKGNGIMGESNQPKPEKGSASNQ